MAARIEKGYVGSFNGDASATAYIAAQTWVAAKGMWYVNTIDGYIREWDGSNWVLLNRDNVDVEMSTGYLFTQAAIPVVDTIGSGVFLGSRSFGATAYFRCMVTNSFVGAGQVDIKFYDVGPTSGALPPVLVTTLTSAVTGGPYYVEQALTTHPATPNTNVIVEGYRMYVVTATMPIGAALDTCYVGCAGLSVRS